MLLAPLLAKTCSVQHRINGAFYGIGLELEDACAMPSQLEVCTGRNSTARPGRGPVVASWWCSVVTEKSKNV